MQPKMLKIDKAFISAELIGGVFPHGNRVTVIWFGGMSEYRLQIECNSDEAAVKFAAKLKRRINRARGGMSQPQGIDAPSPTFTTTAFDAMQKNKSYFESIGWTFDAIAKMSGLYGVRAHRGSTIHSAHKPTSTEALQEVLDLLSAPDDIISNSLPLPPADAIHRHDCTCPKEKLVTGGCTCGGK
jgi:hypothetical protein